MVCTKADHFDTVYVEVRGQDANPLKADKAFVNVTSDKNSSLKRMIILSETGISTGTYRGTILIESMEYFENITLRSVEDPSKTATFMIHTPVQVRCLIDPTKALEDSEYRARFYNFGYNTVTWSLQTEAEWLSWDPGSYSVFGTPDNSHVGRWTVMIEATDYQGNKATYPYTLEVVNVAPRILTQNVLYATENQPYLVDYDSTDDGKGIISWYLDTDMGWLSMDKDSGILSGTPQNEDVGVHWAKVMVDDGNEGRNFTQFSLTVIDVNQRPVIITDDIHVIAQDTPFRRQYEVHDPDSGDEHLWSVVTDADWLAIDELTGVLSGTPKAWHVGTFKVNVTVHDLGGLHDSRIFNLTVTDVKDKPVFIDVPALLVEIVSGQLFRFDVNATDYDIGDVVTYSITTDPSSDMTINGVTGVMIWTATRSVFKSGDTMTITIKASDGELFSVYVFSLKVLPTGSPNATILSPSNNVRVRSGFVILQWEGSDPEGEALTYSLYLSDSRSFVEGMRSECCIAQSISSTEYNMSGLSPGNTYHWTVIPSDGGSFGSCDSGISTFKVNNAPKIERFDDPTAYTGKEFRFKVKGSDADPEDSENLVYTLVRYPEGMTIDKNSGIIRWTPGEIQLGDRLVRVELSDGIEKSSYEFSVNVLGSEDEGSPIWLIILIVAILLIIIAAILFFLLRRKKEEKEEGVDDESKEIVAEMERHQNVEEMGNHAPEVVHSSVPLSAAEAHAMDGKDRPQTYEDLYGSPAPKEEEALTASELKDEIKDMVTELENSAKQS